MNVSAPDKTEGDYMGKGGNRSGSQDEKRSGGKLGQAAVEREKNVGKDKEEHSKVPKGGHSKGEFRARGL